MSQLGLTLNDKLTTILRIKDQHKEFLIFNIEHYQIKIHFSKLSDGFFF